MTTAYECPDCRSRGTACPCHDWTHAGGPCGACFGALLVELDEAAREVSRAESNHEIRSSWEDYREIRNKIDARVGALRDYVRRMAHEGEDLIQPERFVIEARELIGAPSPAREKP